MMSEFIRNELSRRGFLSGAAAGALALTNPFGWLRAAEEGRRPKVAVVFTECTYRSHAHVILENFLEPYLFNGHLTNSSVEVVALCADQLPEDRDMIQKAAEQYGIPLYKTIDEALCLGGKELAVDGVVSIGEHGDYPHNELGQHMYPRKEFFDQIVAVMKRSKRFVPMFNDKHLSYRWDWAKEMVDTADELGIPLMAGSSVPLAERQPPLELSPGLEIEEAISIHGGGVESYDFHALEVLQSMVEARKGGETGISKVEFLDHEALWKAADEGRWSRELARAALETDATEPFARVEDLEKTRGKAHGILLEYRDGMRGLILRLSGGGTKWQFACRVKDDPKPKATSFYVGPWDNRNLFKALSHAIQYHLTYGQAPYPVERTLLVSGILEAEMHSKAEGGKPQGTPELEFNYQAKDYRAFREMGASWKILNEDVPQPAWFDPQGDKT